MGTEIVVVVQLPDHYDNCQVNGWRRDILNAFDPDDFGVEGPLFALSPGLFRGPVPPGQTWINVNLQLNWGAGDFTRGDGRYITRILEWLKTNIRDAQIWIGHDAGCGELRPFGADGPTILLDYP